MNYQRIYNEIIENRKKNTYSGYTERPHRIPRSFGGSDNHENLINLSAREHFLCHYLLMKINENDKFKFYKMIKAFAMMCNAHGDSQERYVNSRLYESCRESFRQAMCDLQGGKKNSQYGTMWISNLKTRKNKKIQKDEEIIYPWVKGRNKWKEEEHKQKIILNKERTSNNRKEIALKLWDKFKAGNYKSVRQFYECNKDNISITRTAVSRYFSKILNKKKKNIHKFE